MDQTLGVLSPLLRASQNLGRTGSAIENLAIQALAFEARGDSGEALDRLDQALTLAQPGGYLRTFIEEGTPMERLLEKADRRGIAPAYTARLLAAFRGGDPDPSAPLSRAGLIEPLTPREKQVLKMLATDLTLPEIAQELVIADSTVRSHVKSIYRKLDVHSRHEAVLRSKRREAP
jgi:LuxR family maltose regulon positive regulatory protein